MGVQKKLLHYLRSGNFMTVGGSNDITSDARIMGTTSEDIEKFVLTGKFDPDLLALLQTNTMIIPPIRKRKSDLRLLVDFIIIMECFKTPDRKLIKGISPEAYKRIMEYDWPGNMDELQVVIRRAINLAQGDYLLPEDIFIGIAPPEGKYTINLLQFEKVRNFFRRSSIKQGLQVLTASAFTLIVILSFAGNQSPDKNVALIMVWGLWEPLLVISWFFAARFWCSVCPMGAVNDLLNRIGMRKLKVPAFIINYGLYFSAAGLVAIILMEVITHMPYSPMATGILLLSITAFAILSGLLFERRVWCRYLCPLGTLGAMFSGCSIVEWRSNTSICNSTCKDNICYKGDRLTRGCPLYQGPFSLHSNQNCILCGNCVKLCMNDSPAFNLRIPGHELWAALKPEKVTTVFMPVVLSVQILRAVAHTSLIEKLAQRFEPMWIIYAALLALFTVISFAYTQISGALVFGKLRNSSIIRGDIFIHAIIPLSFAFEIGYQIMPLLSGLSQFLPTLGRQLGFNWELLGLGNIVGSNTFWQIILVLIGMSASIAFLKAIIRNHQKNEKGVLRYRRFRYVPIIFLAGIYILIFMFTHF
jgi:polyferredoxin